MPIFSLVILIKRILIKKRCTILPPFFHFSKRSVTDGQTDRQTLLKDASRIKNQAMPAKADSSHSRVEPKMRIKTALKLLTVFVNFRLKKGGKSESNYLFFMFREESTICFINLTLTFATPPPLPTVIVNSYM